MSGKNSPSPYAQYKAQQEEYLTLISMAQSETELNNLIATHNGQKSNKPGRLSADRRASLKALDEQIEKEITAKRQSFAQNENQTQANDELLPKMFNHPAFKSFHAQYNLLLSKKAYFETAAKTATDDATKNTYTAAAKAIGAVTTDIADYVRTYEEDNNLSQLKQRVKTRLNENLNADIQLLKQHRGVGEILANLGLAVFLLPVYLVAAAYKGTLFPIKLNTDSAKKLTQLNEAVEELNVEDSSTPLRASQVDTDPMPMSTVDVDEEFLPSVRY
ncbi:MAG: hypothetical protein CK426_05575 [Legionella sp.]|nr:MAG: hypothetical protein CK423_08200 [Legionella sp.]PJD98619.1 MAG: hypothetical protein CK426_05575 [Legionella sp.]